MREFWQKFLKIASSAVVLAVFALLAYAEIYVFVSSSFFEINRALYGGAVLSVFLIALFGALTLFFGVSLYLSLYHKEVERCGVLTFAAELLTIAVGAVLPLILYFARTVESAVFLKTLPYFLAGLAAVAFLLLIPLAKKRWYLAFVAIAVTVIAILGFSAVSAHGDNVSFEADPVVFDNGKDFSVVWCTDVNSVGYLEYSYGGQTHVVYDEEDGKYRADGRVHVAHVPYDHLYGNTYTVSSAKVLRNATKYSKIGKFVTSESYAFAEKVTGDSLKMLSLTDWHEKNDSAYVLAAMRADYDLLLLMGDEINYVNEFDDILNYVVIPGGNISGGVKPVLFVRGNHETRGKYAEYLKGAIGMDSFYFTTSYGNVNLLVLDGAEDKPDSDPKSGGLFLSEAYRDRELDEMEALPVKGGVNVCLCHIPLFSTGKDTEQYARFSALLEKHNVKLLLSGHEHYLEYEEGEAFDTLIAGGPTDTDGYVACFVTINDKKASVEAYNSKGTVATYGPIALD